MPNNYFKRTELAEWVPELGVYEPELAIDFVKFFNFCQDEAILLPELHAVRTELAVYEPELAIDFLPPLK